MFSRISKIVLLAGCLAAAGGASAYERSAVVPVIAGVTVGVLLGSAYSNARDDRHRHDYYPPKRVVYYQPHSVPHHRYSHASRPVRYVAVPVREHRGEHRHERHGRHERHDRRH
ncbi:hypothetical protein HP532_10700 [Pseudomonas sp. CrR25]|nr:hypothetical protein [Pseudomonas sp. CrR25]